MNSLQSSLVWSDQVQIMSGQIGMNGNQQMSMTIQGKRWKSMKIIENQSNRRRLLIIDENRGEFMNKTGEKPIIVIKVPICSRNIFLYDFPTLYQNGVAISVTTKYKIKNKPA